MRNILIAAIATAMIGAVAHTAENSQSDETLFVHSVYFWLKDDVTPESRDTFMTVLRGLEQIQSVQALELGVPANTPREVVDNSYDVALLVYFDDVIGHDEYQADQIHKDAIDVFEDWIADIKIFDAVCSR